MRPRILLVLLAGILASFIIFLTGCGIGDGALKIRGIAYEWGNAPAGATSKIYIANVVPGEDIEPTLRSMLANIPSDISKIPLENVEISVWNKKTIETTGDKYYYLKTTSNSTGEFDEWQIIGPGKMEIRVKASKAGYMEVFGDVVHDVFTHVIVAILVRKNSQN